MHHSGVRENVEIGWRCSSVIVWLSYISSMCMMLVAAFRHNTGTKLATPDHLRPETTILLQATHNSRSIMTSLYSSQTTPERGDCSQPSSLPPSMVAELQRLATTHYPPASSADSHVARPLSLLREGQSSSASAWSPPYSSVADVASEHASDVGSFASSVSTLLGPKRTHG